MNYYELFDIKETPVVDKSNLTKKYFELQREFHPDFHNEENIEEQEKIIEKSALINKAYNTFKDSQLTLEYFLKLKGLIHEDEKYSLPDDFLMEMMDFNEELADMLPSEANQKVRQIESNLNGTIELIIQNQKADFRPEELEVLKEYYYKKKYLQRILDRLAD